MIGQCNQGHRVDDQNVTTDLGTVSMFVCLECDRIKCPTCKQRIADGFARRCPNCKKPISEFSL